MLLPRGVVTLLPIGGTGEAYWEPASPDGAHVALEDGESVLWTSACEVRSAGSESWKLPSDTTVVVTDRRLAFLTTKFDPGGGWVGFGAAGLAVATVANVVSKQRAAARSAGLVVLGHLRYEWLTGLTLRREKALIGVVDTYVDLNVATNAGTQRITLWGPVVGEQLARWLATVVSGHRLTVAVPRTAQETGTLDRYVAGGHDDVAGRKRDVGWRFPGGTETLVRAVAPLAVRRAAGDPPQPGDRPMVALCPFGAPSADPDSLPAYDSAGALVVEPAEQVLWQGPAAAVVTAAAKAASGREVFQTMWTSAGAGVELTLTDRRLVYRLVPHATGAPVAPGPVVLVPPDPATGTVAGQVRHRNVPNLLALDGAEYAVPGLFRSVASVIDPPNTVIRVHVLFADRESACDRAWIRAVAAERMAALPEYADSQPPKWAALVQQANEPSYADGHYGPAAQLPLACMLGATKPR